ncbi:hypothetical protein DPMN_036766 [Dreissena polymorpha]|uniref:Integrin beta subunit VWA domain-containing protein n=1 Tax=Dreissena polymorpha TaxID=45954 RepID=A0A9D4MC63_DREPO|nr:hypothetical protein DPMN_036766 [Dreissena polymorpha]
MTFRLAENYPVDLYYLMDLSNSMKDDKENLAALGNKIGMVLTLCMLGNLSSAKMSSAEFLKLAFTLIFYKEYYQNSK